MAEPDEHHLSSGAPVGGGFNLAQSLEQHLPATCQRRHRNLVGQFGAAYTLIFGQLRAPFESRHRLDPGQRVNQLQKVAQQQAKISPGSVGAIREVHHLGRFAGHHGVEQIKHGGPIGEA